METPRATLDPVFQSFLERQHVDGMALAAASDILELQAGDAYPSMRYQAHFKARTLVQRHDGSVALAEHFTVALCFPPDYRRRAVQPPEVIMWLEPHAVFHPNIRWPFLCPGHLTTQTTLVDLLYQVYEIGTFQRVTMHERDALNGNACAWARQHTHLLPLDRRPLKRAVRLQASVTEGKA